MLESYNMLELLKMDQCQTLIGLKEKAQAEEYCCETVVYRIKDQQVSDMIYRLFQDSIMPVNYQKKELYGISDQLELYEYHSHAPTFVGECTSIWLSPIEYKEWYHVQIRETSFGPSWYRKIKYHLQFKDETELTSETKYVLLIRPLYK